MCVVGRNNLAESAGLCGDRAALGGEGELGARREGEGDKRAGPARGAEGRG